MGKILSKTDYLANSSLKETREQSLSSAEISELQEETAVQNSVRYALFQFEEELRQLNGDETLVASLPEIYWFVPENQEDVIKQIRKYLSELDLNGWKVTVKNPELDNENNERYIKIMFC